MNKIGKKTSFLIGNLVRMISIVARHLQCSFALSLSLQFLIPTIIVILISESPIYLLFIAAILGANTVACGYVMPWFVSTDASDNSLNSCTCLGRCYPNVSMPLCSRQDDVL